VPFFSVDDEEDLHQERAGAEESSELEEEAASEEEEDFEEQPAEIKRTSTASQPHQAASAAAAKGGKRHNMIPQEAFASVHDLVHWAILAPPPRCATLRQIYVTCVERGRIAHKRGVGSRLITANEHWKSQIRHALYTSPRFTRHPTLEDGWNVSQGHMYVPTTVTVMVEEDEVKQAAAAAEVFKAKLRAKSGGGSASPIQAASAPAPATRPTGRRPEPAANVHVLEETDAKVLEEAALIAGLKRLRGDVMHDDGETPSMQNVASTSNNVPPRRKRSKLPTTSRMAGATSPPAKHEGKSIECLTPTTSELGEQHKGKKRVDAARLRVCETSSDERSGVVTSDQGGGVELESPSVEGREHRTEIIHCAPIAGTTVVPSGRDWSRNRRKPLKGRVPQTPVLKNVSHTRTILGLRATTPNRLCTVLSATTTPVLRCSHNAVPPPPPTKQHMLGTETPPNREEPRVTGRCSYA